MSLLHQTNVHMNLLNWVDLVAPAVDWLRPMGEFFRSDLLRALTDARAPKGRID